MFSNFSLVFYVSSFSQKWKDPFVIPTRYGQTWGGSEWISIFGSFSFSTHSTLNTWHDKHKQTYRADTEPAYKYCTSTFIKYQKYLSPHIASRLEESHKSILIHVVSLPIFCPVGIHGLLDTHCFFSDASTAVAISTATATATAATRSSTNIPQKSQSLSIFKSVHW